MDLKLEQLDDDTRPFFEQAYAKFRERTTCDEAFRNREPFKGPGRNTTPVPLPKMTVALAFEQVILCRARVARNEGPASAAHIEQVWHEFYALKYRYVPRQHEFPAAELAKLQLSILVFHDVFSDIKVYKSEGTAKRSKPPAKYPARPESFGEIMNAMRSDVEPPLHHAPYNLVVQTAKTFAKKIRKDKKDLLESENFLERHGYRVRHCDHAELRKMQQQEANERLYPRTYL